MDQRRVKEISADGWGDLDAVVDAFEAAWRSGDAPDIGSIVGRVPLTDRTALLHELVRVDLEFRWKHNAGHAINGSRRSIEPYAIEDYVARIPELGAVCELPLDLIVEEYRVRQRWGDRPGAAEFLGRFPDRTNELAAELVEADRELEAEIEAPAATDLGLSSALANFAHIPQFDYRDFVLEAYLGSGGAGKVYRAWWKSRNRLVALKMLRKSYWRQPGAGELFYREAEILVGLRHENIVNVHGIGCTPRGGCFLALDLIDGGDLGQRIKSPVSIAQAIDWTAQAAEGLAFAHGRGVVHRDLKPSNLLLDRCGRVLIADFGLALVLSARCSVAGNLVGTVAYMAPEQLVDGRRVGPAADVFGLGAVLHALLVGQPPYEGHDVIDVVERRFAASPRTPIRALRPELPEDVVKIVARCLEAKPSQRYTAKELTAALRALHSAG
jgi:tRNA A-37 threonylcarbamoyl transferase component Bud32